MTGNRPDEEADEWSEWLLHRRHGDDPTYDIAVQESVARFAENVLDAAHISPGMTLLDIGSGEGLVAFRAIERFGAVKVILTDISAPMLLHAEQIATHRKVSDQCRFLQLSAQNLAGIADASIDVVVARAAIAYVSDKTAAFNEFHRVLKPGGFISIAEPILQDEAFLTRVLRTRIEAQTAAPRDPFLGLLHRWKSAQFPDTEAACAESPIVNFSERNLVNFANAAGFTAIHMRLHIDIMPSLVTNWSVFLGISPHPWAPSLATILEKSFSPDERDLFEKLVRPTVESGKAVTTDRVAYLNARKPLCPAS